MTNFVLFSLATGVAWYTINRDVIDRINSRTAGVADR